VGVDGFCTNHSCGLFEKHLIFQNAHMGWMDGCWIMLDKLLFQIYWPSNSSTQLIIGEFAGSTHKAWMMMHWKE
jgi:hypothetical protein